jgi:hypothetical protein
MKEGGRIKRGKIRKGGRRGGESEWGIKKERGNIRK